MATIVRHAIVLLIADDRDCGVETATALAGMGCLAHRLDPDSSLDRMQPYDAAVLIADRNTQWCAAVLGRLRTTEFACASLVLLASGGPEEVAESMRRGAADCLIRPVSEPELLESISGVIESTRRWRARFSRARLLAVTHEPLQPTPLQPTNLGAAAARMFEPVEQVTVVVPVVSDNPEHAKIEAVVERVSGDRGLTRRERQVLYWLLLGHRYVDIASVLGVAPRTAKFHAANLLQKLELDSRYDLARLLAEEFGPEQG